MNTLRGVTADYVRSVLDYDLTTGVFVWRGWRGGRAGTGTVAGSIVGGYRRIKLRKKLYSAHRLAWLYVHGTWPPHDIDHINLDRDDNRIANLRCATRSQNIANTSVRADNKTRLRGVTPSDGGFIARLTVCGERQYLGFFKTAELAHAAYINAAKEAYGEFHRV